MLPRALPKATDGGPCKPCYTLSLVADGGVHRITTARSKGPTHDPWRQQRCAIVGRPRRAPSDLGTATFLVCPYKREPALPHQIPKIRSRSRSRNPALRIVAA